MSKYKVGDKVVVEIEKATLTNNGGGFYVVLDYMQSAISVDEKTEPLSAYTEPLEAKIKRQAAEITRLLAENAEIQGLNNTICDICKSDEFLKEMAESAREEGQEEAWELARKIFDMETNDIEDIFIKEDAWNLGTVLNNYTYQEAAAKVAEWEKIKEIKVGDIVKTHEGNDNDLCVLCMSTDKKYYNAVDGYGAVYYMLTKEMITKTGRHIDIDSFLKQIGEE